MPTPGQHAPPAPHLKELFDEIFSGKKAPDLAHEVAMLREEIAALRAELAPAPSPILTGRQVVEEFKRMKGGA